MSRPRPRARSPGRRPRCTQIPGRILGGGRHRSRLAREVVAAAGRLCGAGPAGHFELDAKQVALFEQHTAEYNARSGRTYTPQQAFDALSLSQQTTFDAVTHALMRSELTDEAGSPLGSPIDLLAGIDRIAGQVRRPRWRSTVPALRPAEARRARRPRKEPRVLPRSREHRVPRRLSAVASSDWQGTEHAVFAVRGRPGGHRRRLPVQPVAAGAVQRPLDVRELDVRVGENPRFHNARWNGFIAPWQDVFGRLNDDTEPNPRSAERRSPAGAHAASVRPAARSGPERIEDAVQEFLTDWLVRRRADQAPRCAVAARLCLSQPSTTTPARKRCQRSRRGCAFGR